MYYNYRIEDEIQFSIKLCFISFQSTLLNLRVQVYQEYFTNISLNILSIPNKP